MESTETTTIIRDVVGPYLHHNEIYSTPIPYPFGHLSLLRPKNVIIETVVTNVLVTRLPLLVSYPYVNVT